ncbi:MAG: dTDP-4-dehydrorhamnose 3,5-epimerase [Planctomycetaceae bacterium]
MKFVRAELSGAWIVEPEFQCDDRGAFARVWCVDEFTQHGLNTSLVQCNISLNHRQGTVRGMHFQRPPHGETKLVRCTRGAILDVIVDLRPESPTFCRSMSCELSADNHRMLYIPPGFAHGFQTLTDNAEVHYQMSHEYHALSADGVRWNDPEINVTWPLAITSISDRDRQWPDLEGRMPCLKSVPQL